MTTRQEPRCSPSPDATRNHTTIPTTPRGSVQPRPFPVSSACKAAMRRLVLTSQGGLIPFASEKGPPSGEAATVGQSVISRTLTGCKSRDEWLAAASATTRLTDDRVAAVLQTDCFRGFMVIDVPSCTVTHSRGGVNFGPCPKTFPNTPLTKLSAGIAGAHAVMVPIAASTVRVCLYGLVSDSRQRVRSTSHAHD